MNRTVAKRVGVEFVVVAGVLFLAHEYGVAPIEDQIIAAESELAGYELENERLGHLTPERAAAVHSQVKSLSETANELNLIGKEFLDPSVMYSRYHSAAAAHEVRLERLDPSTTSSRVAAKSAVDSVGFTVGVSGSFDRVSQFISVLQREFPLTTIEAVRMAPDPQNGPTGQGVIATIKARHFGIVKPIHTTASAEVGDN